MSDFDYLTYFTIGLNDVGGYSDLKNSFIFEADRSEFSLELINQSELVLKKDGEIINQLNLEDLIEGYEPSYEVLTLPIEDMTFAVSGEDQNEIHLEQFEIWYAEDLTRVESVYVSGYVLVKN